MKPKGIAKDSVKQITWKQKNIEGWKIQDFLNQGNFQPGKFLIVPCVDGSPSFVTIVYVEREI